MWYGSRVSRQGRSRPCSRYHASSRRRNHWRTAGAGRSNVFGRLAFARFRGRSTGKGSADYSADRWPCTDLHEDRRSRRDRPVRRHARAQGRPRVDAYGEVDELNALLGLVARKRSRAGARRDAATRSSATVCTRRAAGRPAQQIAARVEKAALGRTTSTRLEGWIDASRASCRRCAISSSPAAARRARCCTSRAPSAGAPSGGWSGSARGAVDALLIIYVNRLSDLLFVMARVGQPSRGRAGTRVVSTPRSSPPHTTPACAWRASTTKTFRWRRGWCRRDAPAHRRRLRVRARRRRLRGRGTRSNTARLALLDDWRRLSAPGRGRRHERFGGKRGSDCRRDLPRARATRFAPATSSCSCSTICSARFARTSSSRATRPGRSCWTTAAARPIQSAGWSCASPAIATTPGICGRTRCAPRLQLTNFWQDLERDWANGRVYVPQSLLRRCRRWGG